MIGNTLGFGIAQLVIDTASSSGKAVRKFGETIEQRLSRTARYTIGGLATAAVIAGSTYSAMQTPEPKPSLAASSVLALETEKNQFVSNLNRMDGTRERILQIPQVKEYLDSLDREKTKIMLQPGVSGEVSSLKALYSNRIYGVIQSFIGMSAGLAYIIYVASSEEKRRGQSQNCSNNRHEDKDEHYS